MEHWELIEDFPGYEVSSEGRVRNEHSGRILGIFDNGHGVLQVTLRRDGRNNARAVNRLVATAFIHPGPDDAVPVFLDGDPTNLRAENLEWRPYWFAVRRTAQRKRKTPMDPRPVEMMSERRVFDNALQAAITIDGLEEQILYAARNTDRVTHKGSRWRFFKN